MGLCNFKDVLEDQDSINSPNLGLHPAVRDNLFQSLRSARHHIYYDDHQELMNLVDQEWTQKFIRSIFKPLQIGFLNQV